MASKRITFTKREVQFLVEAIKSERDKTSLPYAVISAGKQVYNDMLAKLEPKAGDPGFAESKRDK